MNEILSAALRYLDDGNPIIPVDPDVKKDKAALVKWKPYQTQLPEPGQVEEWWTRWPDAMIGGITGALAQRTVIDTDPPDGEEHLEPYLPDNCETPTIATPRDGKHRIFQYFKPAPNVSCLCGLEHVDCRNDGGYHVLPPSRNSAGGTYKWLIPPDTCDLLPMPRQLCILLPRQINIER